LNHRSGTSDTGGKFTAGVTAVNLPPGELRIFLRIFELKIRNGTNVITGGPLRKMILERKKAKYRNNVTRKKEGRGEGNKT
jgi:hypothetical protein